MSWVLKYAFPVNQFSVYKVNGRDLYLASDDFTIRQWSIPQQKITCFFSGHTGRITSIEYCNDLDALLSTSTDGKLIVWRNGRMVSFFLNKQRKGDTFGSPLYSVCYSQQKGIVFVGGHSEILFFKLSYEFVQKASERNISTQVVESVQIKPFQRIKLHSQIITK